MNLATQAQIPDVPQVPLERYVPPRGISPRMKAAIDNAAVRQGISGSIQEGIGMGADKWYHTEPIRQAFIDELGSEAGPRAFAQFMDQVAATSPRSDVPTNIRNASYYYQHARAGQPLPEQLPYPYGHVAQNLHRQNFEALQRGFGSPLGAAVTTGWDIFRNPKPASFSQNLQGNLAPGTMDTHAFRNIGMRTEDPRFLATSLHQLYKPGVDPAADTLAGRYGEVKGGKVAYRPQQLLEQGKLTMAEAKDIPGFWASQPNANEYAAAEQLYRELGKTANLPTADAQAAAWAGGGKLTGLGSEPNKTFSELFNERVLYTSMMRGEHPRDTLRMFITGKKPLLSITGLTALLAGQREQQDQNGGPQL